MADVTDIVLRRRREKKLELMEEMDAVQAATRVSVRREGELRTRIRGIDNGLEDAALEAEYPNA